MQVLQAGAHKYLLLELDHEFVENICRQAGFEVRLDATERSLVLDLVATSRQAPLLLFDAADPGNLGWFSRCQFYVDGNTGHILQTPISVANMRDRGGRAMPNSIRVKISKELPASFQMPGKQPVTEQVVYAVLFNILNALTSVGVGVCGNGSVRPLAGRGDQAGSRN
jgi:hypothetical protein